MADEKKKATKPATKSAAPAASAAAAPAAKAAKPRAPKGARSHATPAAAEGERCRADGCKQPVRAKGYCRKHYIGWRRAAVGKKHRYNICSKEGCRKPAVFAGTCAEHKKNAAPAAAA
jgi:hypothetical protein